MKVDEAWRHDESVHIDDTSRRGNGKSRTDGCDAVPHHGHVGSPSRGAGPVDDVAAAEEQVVRPGPRLLLAPPSS
jgi:hypothetical protein